MVRIDARPPAVTPPSRVRRLLPKAWLAFFLTLAALCLCHGRGEEPLGPSSPAVVQAGIGLPFSGADLQVSAGRPECLTRAIENLEVGARTLGRNPLRYQVEPDAPEPDPATWRKLVLRMRKPSGRSLFVNLLRPVEWIDRAEARVGGTVFLDLPEMGAVGDARVEAIEPCPAIEPGEGNVVTGTFRHEADPDTVILQVAFSDGTRIDGVTDNHPFWSEDRQDFIPAGDLREGDRVQATDGIASVASVSPRLARPGEMLFNLEVHNEHVYQVTTAGIVVHNSCLNRGGRFSDLDKIKSAGEVPHHCLSMGGNEALAFRRHL